MIDNVKSESICYMAFVGVNQKGLFKVKIERDSHIRTFHEFKIIDFIFKNEEYSSRLGTAKDENLFDTFKDALEWFKEKADYTEQDMIIETFDRKSAFMKRIKRTATK